MPSLASIVLPGQTSVPELVCQVWHQIKETTIDKMAAPKRMRVRNCCFTWNNPPVGAVDQIRALTYVQYACIGEEVGASGTPHLQGYLEFRNPKDFNVVHKALGNAHIEPRRGTAEQAAAYCRKGTQARDQWKVDGEDGVDHGRNAVVHEWGEMSQQGHRTDIKAAVDLITEEKASIRTVALECPLPFVKFHKGFTALRYHHIPDRHEHPEVVVYWGATGTGKSRRAREDLASENEDADETYVWGPGRGKWFDGMDGHEKVIFEEFRGQLPFGMLLRLLDRYTEHVEYKGGTTKFVAKKIIITSPLPPDQWYKDLDTRYDRLEQLMRRITRVECLDPPTEVRVPQDPCPDNLANDWASLVGMGLLDNEQMQESCHLAYQTRTSADSAPSMLEPMELRGSPPRNVLHLGMTMEELQPEFVSPYRLEVDFDDLSPLGTLAGACLLESDQAPQVITTII